MDTDNRRPEQLTASIHDGRREYVAATLLTVARLSRQAGGNVPAYKGVVTLHDHDEKSIKVLWTGEPTSAKVDAFDEACRWVSAWLLDIRGAN